MNLNPPQSPPPQSSPTTNKAQPRHSRMHTPTYKVQAFNLREARTGSTTLRPLPRQNYRQISNKDCAIHNRNLHPR